MSMHAASRQYEAIIARQSPLRIFNAFEYAAMKRVTFPQVCITPFGLPVEPEVYSTYASARSSGTTRAAALEPRLLAVVRIVNSGNGVTSDLSRPVIRTAAPESCAIAERR